jgi:hypothetical protein
MGLIFEGIARLFFHTQSMETQSILNPGEHTILTLDVTTTELGERVKLDSMAVIQYLTNTVGTTFRLAGEYLLYRDNTLISLVDIEENGFKPESSFLLGNIYPNLTWADVPPSAGTHRYQIRINTSNLTNNLVELNVLTAHSLNAIVLGPAA